MCTVTGIHQLTDPGHLRAYVATLSHDLERPEERILEAIVAALKSEQRRHGDDIAEVLILGQVLQVAMDYAAHLRNVQAALD
jgi:hypothetical protein